MSLYTLFLGTQLSQTIGNDIFSAPTNYSLAEITTYVQEGRQALLNTDIDDLIAFLANVAAEWSKPDSPIQKNYSKYGLNFLIYWMQERHLKEIVDLSLRGNRKCLDGFASLTYSADQFLANPRGIICHWLSGNVPILGLLSLIQGILTKNANILKVSKQNGHVLPNLLQSIRSIECKAPSGKIISGSDISRSIAAVYFDSKELEAQKQLSKIANVRIAWGGREAIESIMNIPKSIHTEDVVFGPKTSFMLIGKEALQSEADATDIAKRAAIDASVFEQRGCNSPHTIFIEKGGNISPNEFAKLLSVQMDNALKRYPKEPVLAGDSVKIVSLRTQYDMYAEAYYPKGMDWSVLYSDHETGLATPCYNRTVFVRPIEDIFELENLCSQNTQSIGVALSPERKLEFATRVSRKGVDRLPKVGAMTAHEIPWDGLFMMDRFVRWCRIT